MDKLGNITLYNADCMELMRNMPDKAYDLAIVDPPYGLSEKSTQGAGKLKNRVLNRGVIKRWDVSPPPRIFRRTV